MSPLNGGRLNVRFVAAATAAFLVILLPVIVSPAAIHPDPALFAIQTFPIVDMNKEADAKAYEDQYMSDSFTHVKPLMTEKVITTDEAATDAPAIAATNATAVQDPSVPSVFPDGVTVVGVPVPSKNGSAATNATTDDGPVTIIANANTTATGNDGPVTTASVTTPAKSPETTGDAASITTNTASDATTSIITAAAPESNAAAPVATPESNASTLAAAPESIASAPAAAPESNAVVPTAASESNATATAPESNATTDSTVEGPATTISPLTTRTSVPYDEDKTSATVTTTPSGNGSGVLTRENTTKCYCNMPSCITDDGVAHKCVTRQGCFSLLRSSQFPPTEDETGFTLNDPLQLFLNYTAYDATFGCLEFLNTDNTCQEIVGDVAEEKMTYLTGNLKANANKQSYVFRCVDIAPDKPEEIAIDIFPEDENNTVTTTPAPSDNSELTPIVQCSCNLPSCMSANGVAQDCSSRQGCFSMLHAAVPDTGAKVSVKNQDISVFGCLELLSTNKTCKDLENDATIDGAVFPLFNIPNVLKNEATVFRCVDIDSVKQEETTPTVLMVSAEKQGNNDIIEVVYSDGTDIKKNVLKNAGTPNVMSQVFSVDI